MTTRRQFLKIGAVAGAGTLLPLAAWRAFASVQVPQTPVLGGSIPKYVDPVPTFVGQRVSRSSFPVKMLEFQQKALPASFYANLPAPFNAGTYVWGYKVDGQPAHWPGFSVEAHQGTPTTITYINSLPFPSSSKLEPLFTIDQTIHWADPQHTGSSTQPYKGTIPTTVHLHGAEVPSAFDGVPDSWFTQDGIHGAGYNTLSSTSSNSAIYQYPNTQPATMLWFHDHALGLTRINVFSGLATAYLLRDQFDTGLSTNPLRLPAGNQEIELIIQDRQFDTNGQLLFPDGTPADNPSGLNGTPPNPGAHPFWIPEFFGDVITVNGKSWPFLNVEPRRYRFRFLNACNARFLQMQLVDSSTLTSPSKVAGPPIWQIGTDGGLLDHPAKLDDPNNQNSPQLFIAPSERADVIIDFTGLSGRSFTLTNTAVFPFPSGGAPDPNVDGQVMQFRVNLPLSSQDTTFNPANGGSLRGGRNQEPAIVRLANPATGTLAAGVHPSVTRQLILLEVEGPGGPFEVTLNNSHWNGLREGTSTPLPGSQPDQQGQGLWLTELPRVGSTEVWQITNTTQDAHPIHIHLIQFQLINRQNVDITKYRALYDSQFPGGTFPGFLPDGTIGPVTYAPGTFIQGYGPPNDYNKPNAAGALGGNPDVTPFLQGSPIPPDPNEAGWKDTLKMFPGQTTRIAIRWSPTEVPVNGVAPGQNKFAFDPTRGPGYVWHCHILDHEDNEMMRPYAPTS